MEKIYSTRRCNRPARKHTTSDYHAVYVILGVFTVLLAIVAVLSQAAAIGAKEGRAAASLQAPASYLAAPPQQSDSLSVSWTPTEPDAPVWVELTPGRSGLTN